MIESKPDRPMNRKAVKKFLKDELVETITSNTEDITEPYKQIVDDVFKELDIYNIIHPAIMKKLLDKTVDLLDSRYSECIHYRIDGKYIYFSLSPDYLDYGEESEWNLSITELCRDAFEMERYNLEETIVAFENGLKILKGKEFSNA